MTKTELKNIPEVFSRWYPEIEFRQVPGFPTNIITKDGRIFSFNRNYEPKELKGPNFIRSYDKKKTLRKGTLMEMAWPEICSKCLK